MAVESPAAFNQSASYSAEQTRRAIFSAYARTAANTPGIIAGGLLSGTDCQLTAPASGLSVNVSTGELIIGGNEGGTQGGYYARVTSQTNLSISAANPTNPRIDLVCATVSDSGYTEPTGGSGNQWALQVITGTPTAGATLSNLNGAGSLPGSSLVLGYVLVPASATNIITADILNVAVMATDALPGLAYVNGASNLTARNGQWIEAAAGVTVTLPSPAAGATIAITAKNGVTSGSPVTVSGTSIYGVGLSAASSFVLGTPGAGVVLEADGANWYTISGPRDTGWIALGGATGWGAQPGAYAPSFRVIGSQVFLKGGWVAGATPPAQFTTMPSVAIPASTVQLPVANASTGGAATVQITNAGAATTSATSSSVIFYWDGQNYSLI